MLLLFVVIKSMYKNAKMSMKVNFSLPSYTSVKVNSEGKKVKVKGKR